MKSKLLVALGLLSSALAVIAQPSTFTYQGQLSSDGSAATGLFDLRFTLFDAASLGNQVGSSITNAPLGVTNGLFTTTLTFGAAVFDGNSRWLEIGVRTNGAGAFTNLTPRQLLTATPYAVRAAFFSGAVGSTNITGKINDTNLSVNVALLTNNAVFTRTVTASNFIGNGITLTNLSTTNLVGTLPDSRLSTNVAFLNTSNAAFLGSISATNFYGEGRGMTNVPGRIFEVIPTAVNVQAFANFGYLATNDATPVVVTLPATANIRIGETIRVSASGAAGWIIAQNTNQSILVANLTQNVGVSWITNSTALPLKAIASSADGRRMVAATSGGSGQIFTSVNYGTTWVGQTVLGNISAVASSADGMKLVAVINGGLIYISSNGGTNWTSRATSRNWSGVASSLDGVKLAACSSTGIFVSSDSGVNWSASAVLGAAAWSGVAMSGNGENVAATLQGGQIYTSNTNGVFGSWFARESNRSWTCLASSADGSVLVAGVNTGNNYVYVSTDFGVNWIPSTVAAGWSGVACSADGARMIAVVNGGGVYISQDTGATWQLRNNLPSAVTYTGAASSSDGSTMAAVASASGIYVSSKSSTTVGATGSLIGSRLAAVELEHVGNGVFIPISYVGTIRVK